MIDMIDILRPILEIAILIPGFFIAYLPTKSFLKYSPSALACWLFPLMLFLVIAGGAACFFLKISVTPIRLLLVLICTLIYMRSLTVNLWISVSISLAVFAVLACATSLVRGINAIWIADELPSYASLWFSLPGCVIYHIFFWLLILIAWYPLSHATRDLVESENFAQTWYIFWLVPLVFIGLNVFMVPQSSDILYTGRILEGYIVINMVLIAILALFYIMFFMVATSLNKNAKLQQENQLLSMQHARYENLQVSIEEARQARHDMRHHYNHLSIMAEHGDLDKIREYLSAASERIPNLDTHLCENYAADSVIWYYYTLARRDKIPFQAKADIPASISIDELDLGLILSNLLENALEASQRTDPSRRNIKLEAYMPSPRLLLIQVENSYDGTILQSNDGTFISTKTAEVSKASKSSKYSKFSGSAEAADSSENAKCAEDVDAAETIGSIKTVKAADSVDSSETAEAADDVDSAEAAKAAEAADGCPSKSSIKRKRHGIGIQSVRNIADKTGGDSSFYYENGIFTAKVMLRSPE